jgi:predicted dehydrogenase
MPILLIGYGGWGEKHLRVLRELGQEVWVADVSPGRRARAVQHGAAPERTLADYREGLAAVTAVDVVTPADSHGEIAAACLAAGRHCFVEKPLSVTAAEGQELARAARDGGQVLQVGHILRFHPVTATLRAALREGRIGGVRHVAARFAGFKRPRTDVGITHTDALHYFDLLAYLLDRRARRVLAMQRDLLGRGLDDLSLTVVHYGDVAAVVEASYFVPGAVRECTVVGETGTLVADFVAGSVVLHAQEFRRSGEGWEALDRGKESLPVGEGEPLKLELAAFLDACAGRGPNLAPAEAGLHAVAIVEAAARSSASGRAVSLRDTGRGRRS